MDNWLKRLFLAALAAPLGACTLLDTAQDSKALVASTVLVGRISTATARQGPIVVAAYAKNGRGVAIAHCTLLHEAGGFELIVPNGEYGLFAFADADRNLRFDAGEDAATYHGAEPVRATGTGVVADLNMTLRPPGITPISAGRRFSDCGIRDGHSTQAGAIADLDDPVFSQEYGIKAYWTPLEFFREVGGNIYFLEPYDPAKIPVLFVHGAAGSPQDWRYFFEHIDRSRYQPWFFYYPSGAEIDSMAHLLNWKLFNLRLKYRFKELYITAHSMGGLVARSLLLHHRDAVPNVKLFVSLSTPWGGEPTAELGVKYSPAVVPSWTNMQPQGRYMQSLFARRLPADVGYYLLFGYKGGLSVMRPNNDGTVTLASELRLAAQAEAKRVYGFDEDHVGILSSPQVLTQYNAILDAAADRRGDAGRSLSGRVRVAFSPPRADGRFLTTPILWLRPLEGKAEAIILPLRSEDANREIGPIPAGKYEANLMALAYKTAPTNVRLDIVPGRTADLGFELTPQGVLAGYIGTNADAAGIPAGGYVPPVESLEIDAITLQGPGGIRKLVPRPPDDKYGIDRYLAGEDDAFGAQFFFVGLPAGEYRLTVLAKGHRPYSDVYTVIPGQPGQWKPIVLQPAE